MIARELYGAVRKTDGKEWVDLSTLSSLQSEADRLKREIDKRIPGWAEANPSSRIGRFRLSETF